MYRTVIFCGQIHFSRFLSGTSRKIENLLDLDHMNIDKSQIHISHSMREFNEEREQTINPKTSIMDQRYRTFMLLTPEHCRRVDFHVDNNTTTSISCSSRNQTSLLKADKSSGTKKTVDFEQFFQEVENNQEGSTRSNSNEKEKPEDDE